MIIAPDNPQSVQLGVIGAGMVSQIAHLPALYRSVGVRLVALADHNKLRADAVASRFGIHRVYATHNELLADPEVKAVVVVVHRHDTPNIVRDALQAGKHVLTEKPMAHTLNVAQELVDLAREKKLTLAIGFMKRHDLGVRRAKELLGQAKDLGFGEIVSVRCRNYCNAYVGHCDDYLRDTERKQRIRATQVSPTWLPTHSQEKYDWFMNVASHTVNLIQYFFSDNVQVCHADFSRPSSAFAIVESDNVPILIDVGKAATGRWDEGIEIYFEQGRMEIQLTSLMQRDRCATLICDRNEKGHTRQIETPDGQWSFDLQAQNFIDTLAGSARLLTSAVEGVHGIEIIQQLWKHYLNSE